MVRAKFRCTRKTSNEDGSNLLLEAVYSDDPASENAQFFKWTPFGRLEMGTINKDAADQFEEGKEYYIDFSPAN